MPDQIYNFLKVELSPTWKAPKYFSHYHIHGELGDKSNVQQLFGCYFFMDDHIVYHNYNAMTILQAMSDLGGLVRVIFFVGLLFCQEINYYNFIAKMIRGRYYENLC